MVDVKKHIPLQIKRFVKRALSPSKLERFNEYQDKKKIIVGLAADYGNLGDVAISYAQYVFLKENFPNYVVIDMPISKNTIEIKALRSIVNDDDIVTTVGGGNLTDKYQDIENLRLMWVKNFPNNKFISFPQTIDFSQTTQGVKSFIRSKESYEKHKNIHIVARETYSYEFMFRKLNCSTYLCPDIVLSLDKSKPEQKREGILCCIRDDQESILTQSKRLNLLSEIAKCRDENIVLYDTHINKKELSWDDRVFEIEKIWSEFRARKLVITDRLHGMIFSVITKTPCIVLINNNHKIYQTYEDWLKPLKHISLIKEPRKSLILAEVEKLININQSEIVLPDISEHYNLLKNIIGI